MTRPEIERRSPRPLANTLTIWPMSLSKRKKWHNYLSFAGKLKRLKNMKRTVEAVGIISKNLEKKKKWLREVGIRVRIKVIQSTAPL